MISPTSYNISSLYKAYTVVRASMRLCVRSVNGSNLTPVKTLAFFASLSFDGTELSIERASNGTRQRIKVSCCEMAVG